jgi:hypothetical protein
MTAPPCLTCAPSLPSDCSSLPDAARSPPKGMDIMGIVPRMLVGCCFLALSFGVVDVASSATLTQPQIAQLLQSADQHVIVILRDQMAEVPGIRRSMGARAAGLASSQRALLGDFPQLNSRKIKAFSTINAFAVTVSQAEAAQISAHPKVQAVVADGSINFAQPLRRRAAAAGFLPAIAGTAPATDNGLCNTLEPEALQLTNAAFADTSRPQAQQVRDGNGQFVTGKGVKVAFLADGLDPTLPGFTRPDGSPVFIDFQDFSGNPAGTPQPQIEAFGDATSLAAQDMPNGHPLMFDISQFMNRTDPMPSPCNIRIRGMSPGASLVGLNVTSFSQSISSVVEAIEYAVTVDDVDVINESFGYERNPGVGNDPISLANDAAVKAGVTVVSITGDGGTTGTLNSPGTESSVILVGASTAYRVYAQTGDDVIPFTNSRGFISNNISALSSAGFSEKNARTVDVVAPGEIGWSLCSTNQAQYQGCFVFIAPYGPSPIQEFSGTSESAPLTAGEAALVIQAYRSTHGGSNPSPALVKQIIMSTATDLGAPASEQGAGLINALAAVNVALSIPDERGRSKLQGSGFLAAPNSARVTAEPNRSESQTFVLTNMSAASEQLTPTVETLGAPFSGANLTLQLDPATAPQFHSLEGPSIYITQTFKVPANSDHLDVAIAFQNPIRSALGTDPALVSLALLDPTGRQAAYSYPQGPGSGYAQVEVIKPPAGLWTAYIYAPTPDSFSSYAGPIQFSWNVERYTKVGTVFPSRLDLHPGESASITAEFLMPSTPGDRTAAIRFETSPSATATDFPEIPLSLRSLVPTGSSGGNFSGILTGGNGRPGVGPYQTFAFDVPSGVKDMSVDLKISDNGYLLGGQLVDPNGMFLSMGSSSDPWDDSPQFGMTLSHYNPQPGRWKFLLVQDFVSSGNQTTLPFEAHIGFNVARISAPTLPNDAHVTLSASAAPVIVPIQVTNTGSLDKVYFADARLNTSSPLQLLPYFFNNSLPGGYCNFIVPTQTRSAAFVAQSNVPIDMEAESFSDTGIAFYSLSPDVYAHPIAPNTVAATLHAPEIPYGFWFTPSTVAGSFGAAGAPTAPLTTSAYVLAKDFDLAVTPSTGDFWLDANSNFSTFTPLILAPGASGTINLSIAPDPTRIGQTISGFIYIDTMDFTVNTGDEVVGIPYSYTVAP